MRFWNCLRRQRAHFTATRLPEILVTRSLRSGHRSRRHGPGTTDRAFKSLEAVTDQALRRASSTEPQASPSTDKPSTPNFWTHCSPGTSSSASSWVLVGPCSGWTGTGLVRATALVVAQTAGMCQTAIDGTDRFYAKPGWSSSLEEVVSSLSSRLTLLGRSHKFRPFAGQYNILHRLPKPCVTLL